MAASLLNSVHATDGEHYLEGIGYREQEPQTAKGSRFQSEWGSGCSWVSFAGGTNIFIKGVGLAENPQSNSVFMHSKEFGYEIEAPGLTEDDAFGSFPRLGSITYRLPSVPELMGLPMASFDQYQTMTFYILIRVEGDEGSIPMYCGYYKYC